MKNQVEALRGYGVKVHMLSSESTMDERQEVSCDHHFTLVSVD